METNITYVYKIVNSQMLDYLDDNLFETDEDLFLINSSYKCCITYDRIDLSEGIDVAKSNSKECMIYLYWFFNHGFKFQDCVCNGCHDLTMLFLDLSDIAIITVKNVDYCYIIHDISKSDAIHLLETSVLDARGCI